MTHYQVDKFHQKNEKKSFLPKIIFSSKKIFFRHDDFFSSLRTTKSINFIKKTKKNHFYQKSFFFYYKFFFLLNTNQLIKFIKKNEKKSFLPKIIFSSKKMFFRHDDFFSS